MRSRMARRSSASSSVNTGTSRGSSGRRRIPLPVCASHMGLVGGRSPQGPTLPLLPPSRRKMPALRLRDRAIGDGWEGGNELEKLSYWEKRKDWVYLHVARIICARFAQGPGSVLDVGSNRTPTLEWHRPSATRLVSLDLRRPY